MEVDQEPEPEKDEKPTLPQTSSVVEKSAQPQDDDDDVIFIDSDDEPQTGTPSTSAPMESNQSNEPNENIEIAKTNGAISRQQSEEDKENKPRRIQKRKECVNPECPRDGDEYTESPNFVMSFYYASKKFNKVPFVCNICHDAAVDKFEVS